MCDSPNPEILRETVDERDGLDYRATCNESRSIEGLDRIPGHTMDYLDSAIPRKRVKKWKGLVRSGWLANS